MEIFGSDIALIGGTLAGLALTALGIVRDLGPLALHPTPLIELLPVIADPTA